MVNARTVGRLGTLAIGLGFGAAVAAAAFTPGFASADTGYSPTIPLIDVLDPSAAVQAALPEDFAVSISGIPLIQDGSAIAISGIGGFAAAEGPNSFAQAGSFDSAVAGGNNAIAVATGSLDSAAAFGDRSLAQSGGDSSSYLDSATTFGTDGKSVAQDGTFDNAYSYGTNNLASASWGSGDTASISGGSDSDAVAGGNGAFLGNHDVAQIIDGTNSSAVAGSDNLHAGSFDLAAVFFSDALHASAQGANFLVDILPSL